MKRFESKKSLRGKVECLEAKLHLLQGIQRENAILCETALPKCKGLYCYQCAYAVYKPSDFGFSTLLLGCGKDAECASFTPVYDKEKVESCPNFQREAL